MYVYLYAIFISEICFGIELCTHVRQNTLTMANMSGDGESRRASEAFDFDTRSKPWNYSHMILVWHDDEIVRACE